VDPRTPPQPLVVKTSFGWVLGEVTVLTAGLVCVAYVHGPEPWWLTIAMFIVPLIVAVRGFGDGGARLVIDATGLTWRATRYGATKRTVWADIASAEIVNLPGKQGYALHLVLSANQVVASIAAGETRSIDISLDSINASFKDLRRAIHDREPRFFTDAGELDAAGAHIAP
jgi:hypothetical protein